MTPPPFLGLIHLLEWLPELTNISLARSLIYYKRIQQPDGRVAQGKAWEKAWSFHSLSRCTSVPQSPCVHQPRSPRSSFWIFNVGFITEAWMIKSAPGLMTRLKSGVGLKKFQSFDPGVCSLGNQPLSLGYLELSKGHLINITKTCLSLSSQEIPRVFRAVDQNCA